MRRINLTSARLASRKVRARSSRPEAEALEGRILLYSTLGQWTYSSRITYSFMPDGTNVGGVPSALFQTMNAVCPTAEWQGQIEQAATIWEANANLNLALVPDGGQAVSTDGNQQDDPRFGDIRIGAVPLPSGVLAETFLPPPSNGGTLAGDILFNSTIEWQVGTGYDIATVAAHEIGHALGLGESTTSSAVMYGTYNGIKTALASDDISGIQSLYTAPQYDQFNTGGHHNSSVLTATNITSYIDGNGQIALPGLDITLPTQSEWLRRDGARDDDRADGGDGAVEQPELAGAGDVHLQLIAGPGGDGVVAEHLRCDDLDVERGDGRAEVLHQGDVGRDLRAGGCVRAGGELRVALAAADPAAQHGRGGAARPGRRQHQ